MTIHQHTGDLLTQPGIIVHGCNCMGAMGSGVAEGIRRVFPQAYKAYVHRYEVFGLQLGDIIAVANPATLKRSPELVRHLAHVHDDIPDGVIVVNAMTQYDYGSDPKRVYVDYAAIEAAFVRVRMLATVSDLPVNFPLIGCGLAKGKWSEVGPRIEKSLGSVDGNLWMIPGAKLN